MKYFLAVVIAVVGMLATTDSATQAAETRPAAVSTMAHVSGPYRTYAEAKRVADYWKRHGYHAYVYKSGGNWYAEVY